MSAERLRALVVEDEWAARDYLVELLDGSGLAEVVGAVASAPEAREILHDGRGTFDVVFLDIRLSGGSNEGLLIARELAALAAPPMVVLATAFNTHAVEAYDLGVSDYLLKPFTEQRVETCLQRLRARRSSPRTTGPARIVARRQKSLVFFDRDEVWAFEAADRLTRIHTAHGIFDIDLSLTAIEASFGRALVRVHRNWLVALAHVRRMERGGELVVGPSLKVPISRDRAALVREALLANALGTAP